MRANRRRECRWVATDNEAKLQMRARTRRNRVDRVLGIAGLERQHFEGIPAEHALGGRKSLFPPIVVDRRTRSARRRATPPSRVGKARAIPAIRFPRPFPSTA